MNIPSLYKYKLDYTGKDPENLVTGEKHHVEPGAKNRIFAVNNGTYFSESLRVYQDGRPLKPWTDYRPIHFFPEASAAVGEDCTVFFKIINQAIDGDIYIDYQVVGDKYGHNSITIEDILWSAVNDDRGVWFVDIEGLPTEWPPAPHIHNVLDIYGWNDRIDIVERYVAMIDVEHDERLEALLIHANNITRKLNNVSADVNEFIHNHDISNNNPHRELKAQVGYDKVDNYATATKADAIEGTREDLRLTVSAAEESLRVAFEQYEKNVIHQGILPVSRYGNLTYLEPGVMGSYEGSSRYNQVEQRPCCLEPDGTLMRLRPGTNGVTIGVYYDYAIKPYANPVVTKLVNTNVTYWPASLGSNWKPYYLGRTMSASVLWGSAYDVSKFPSLVGRPFIAITGDTFDHTKHVTAFLDNTYDLYGGKRYVNGEAKIALIGDKVWFVDHSSAYSSSSPLAFIMGYIPVKDIIEKDEVRWTLLEGPITSKGTPFGTLTGDTVKVSNCQRSRNPDDNPMYLEDGIAEYNIYWARSKFWLRSDDGGKNIYVIASLSSWINSGASTTTRYSQYRFSLNTETKVAEFPDNITQVKAFCINGDRQKLRIEGGGDLFVYDSTLQAGTEAHHHNSGDYYVFNDGTAFMDASGASLNAYRTYTLSKFSDLSLANMWSTRRKGWTKYQTRPDLTSFGSAAKNTLIRPLWRGGNKYSCITVNESNNEERIFFETEGGIDYSYPILNYKTVKGYKPTSKRSVPGLGVVFIATHYWDGSKLTFFGGWGVNGYNINSRPYTFGDDLLKNTDKTVNVDRVELHTKVGLFIEAIKSDLKQHDSTADQWLQWNAEMFAHDIPGKPFIITIKYRYRHPTQSGMSKTACIIVTADYKGDRTGNISGYVIDKSNYTFTILQSAATGIGQSTANASGLIVYKTTDGKGYIVSVHGTYTDHHTTNQGQSIVMLLMDNNFRQVPYSRWVLYSAANTGIVHNHPVLNHDKGFCVTSVALGDGARGTCMGLFTVGKTFDDYFAAKDGTRERDDFVLLGQEVEQGWLVYFTEDTPVIINGREYTIPATSIDLRTIKANPKNTTYYVYVVQDHGQAFYRIYEGQQNATMTRMYIGTIVTGENQIKSINITKRSRLGKYQISDRVAGSSIPVSTGHPFKKGYWDWSSDN
ncbi:hypothetical protein [Proteus mirabilis]|uniref:hypothetical protein n=1 Tax=Proteus mirabilis TaxID=584 RepID=UPI0034D64DD3